MATSKTWREMTPVEQKAFCSQVRKNLARRKTEARRALDARRRQAWQLARRVARLLRERFGARRVVLIGSLARGYFTPWSDIDLVVFGIESERFLQAYGDAIDAGVDAGIRVDLLDGETLSDSFSEDIHEGVEL